MVTLLDLCTVAERSGEGADPLLNACSHPRAAADSLPLPVAHDEAAFDSSWEALRPLVSAPTPHPR